METKVTAEGGYAWFALLACTVLQFLTDGILKSFGLFYVAILEEFKETVTFTTMITGIMNGVYCLTSVPVMMFIIKVIKPRSVLMIGSIITAVGYSMSSLAPSIHFLFFSISFIVGIGTAFIFPPSIFALSTYFSQRRATANGIAISGCCLGGLLGPPLYQYLIDTYHLRGALLLTGAILLHNLPMAGLLRSPSDHHESKSSMAEEEAEECNDLGKHQMNGSEKINGYDRPRQLNVPLLEHDGCNERDKHQMNGSDKMNGYDRQLNGSLIEYNGKDIANGGKECLTNRHVFGGSQPVLCKNREYLKESMLSKENKPLTSSEKCLSTKLLEDKRLDIPNVFDCTHSNMILTLSMTHLNRYGDSRQDGRNLIQEQSRCVSVCTLLRNPSFVSFLFANALATIVSSTFLYFLPLHATQHNISGSKIVILVSLTGAMDLIGRIMCGILADRPELKTYQILVVSQTICGVTYVCNQLLTSFTGLIFFCVLIGLFSGVYLPLRHSMMVEMVGLALYPSALAIATVSQLPVYIAGPIAFGLLRDTTGNFIASYHLIGSVAFMSSLLFLCVPLIRKFTKRKPASREEEMEKDTYG